MPERASRTIFVLELIIFALPIVCGLGFYAILFSGWILSALLVLFGFLVYGLVTKGPLSADAIPSLPKATEVWEGLSLFALPGGALVLSACGLIALWKFVSVATVFTWQGSTALRERRRMFYTGLAWAVPPLAVMIPFGIATMQLDHPGDVISGFYLSGLPLVAPILHLWLELRFRRRDACQSSRSDICDRSDERLD